MNVATIERTPARGGGWELQAARETAARANAELAALQHAGADPETLEQAERRRDRAAHMLDRICEELQAVSDYARA